MPFPISARWGLSAQQLCVLFVAVGGVLCASSTRAYVGEGASWPSGSNVNFQFALGNAGRTLIDGNTSWDTAAMPAPDVWNAIMGNLHFTGVVNASAPVSSGDGVNTISFASTVFGQSFGSSTLAVTYYRYSGGRMSEADVLVNNHQQWDSYRGSLRFGSNGYAIGDIRRVLIHELGHALGLAHPDQNGQSVDAIMNSMISSRETVSADDISGAQSLYGAPLASASTGPETPWLAQVPVTTVATDWRIAGAADFSGNGNVDILWQNMNTGECTIWLMNGTSWTGNESFLGAIPVEWQIAATGDFNGDGKVDIVWQNTRTGQRTIWLMNGTTWSGSESPLPAIPVEWQIGAIGDFNGDGKVDIVWQNTRTGQRTIWLMNHTLWTGGESSLGTVSPEWQIAGTGDFNRDGVTDILWQNTDTGQRTAWLMK